jgi:hypothetical protein
LDPEADRRLYLGARINQAVCLVEAGAPGAEAAVQRVTELLPSIDEPAMIGRVLWLEGRQLTRREDFAAAKEKLLDAREMFERSESTLDVAVVSLDLAILALRLRDRATARRLVEEAQPVFEGLGLRDESLVAASVREEAQAIAERLAGLVASDGITTRSLEAIRHLASRLTT